MDDHCISVTGFGYAPTHKNLAEWAREDIQDDSEAIEVAERVLDWYPDSYPYNEDSEPVFYTEFDISNLMEFKRQLEELIREND